MWTNCKEKKDIYLSLQQLFAVLKSCWLSQQKDGFESRPEVFLHVLSSPNTIANSSLHLPKSVSVYSLVFLVNNFWSADEINLIFLSLSPVFCHILKRLKVYDAAAWNPK